MQLWLCFRLSDVQGKLNIKYSGIPMVLQPTLEELAYTVAPDFPLGRKHYRGECYNPAIVSTTLRNKYKTPGRQALP